jgi:Tol biopolymer transport system component
MTILTHKQACQFVLAAADGLLANSEQQMLAEHLRSCADCQSYQAELNTLENRLQTIFRKHRETAPTPQRTQVSGLQTQHRRNVMNARLSSVLKFAFSSVMLTGLVILMVTSLLNAKNIKSTPTNQAGLQTVSPLPQTTQTQVSDPPMQSTNRLVAFASNQDGNSEIYVMRTDGSGAINLTNNPAYDGNPVWSPDGSKIAFESDRDGNRDIYVMNLEGGDVTRLTKDSANDVLTDFWGYRNNIWSPASDHIIYRNDHSGQWQTYIANMDGSGVTPLGVAASTGLWSPDGSKIAFESDRDGNRDIYVVNADGSNRRSIPLPATYFILEGGMRWSKDGKSLYYIVSKCGANPESCGAPLHYAIYHANPGEAAPALVASTKGNVADYFSDEPGLTYIDTNRIPTFDTHGIDTWIWYNTNGKTTTKLNTWENLEADCKTPNERDQAYPINGFSGSSFFHTEMLVAVNCAKDEYFWLYLVNADGSEIKPLTTNPLPGAVEPNEWSPDGQVFTFTVSDPLGYSQYYVLDILAARNDPSTRPILLPIQNGALQPVAFGGFVKPVSSTPEPVSSPRLPENTSSGDLIAFQSNQNGTSDIYIMKKDGSGLINLTNDPAYDYDPTWSPNGKQIAFQSNRVNIYGNLYIMKADGSGVIQLPDSAVTGFFAWSPDGKQIAYTTSDPQQPDINKINFVNPDGSNLQSIPLNLASDEAFDKIRWSPDGKSVQILTNGSQGPWKIYVLGSQNGKLELTLTSSAEIMDWYGSAPALTYIVKDEKSIRWMRNNGKNQITLTTWKPSIGICSPTNDLYYQAALTDKWSPDGKSLLIALQCLSDEAFYLANADGSQIRQLTNYALGTTPVSYNWSPDGKFIIFSSDLEALGNTDLYILDVQASLKDPLTRPIRFTSSGFLEYAPDWQPKP